MSFTFRVNLYRKNSTVWVREMTYKQYKNIVKSLYEENSISFIGQTNSILQDLFVDKTLYSTLTVVDKLLALLQIRAICVDPDLKLKIKCEKTNKDFEYPILIDSLVKKFVYRDCIKQIEHNNLIVTFSLPKAKDEINFLDLDREQKYLHLLVSSIDSIVYKEELCNFENLSWEQRKNITNRFPVHFTNDIIKNIIDTEETLNNNILIEAKSPYTNEPALLLPLSANIDTLLQFAKFLFTIDLGSVYITTYNLVTRGRFTGEYLDSITPVEVQVYLGYCQKQVEQEAGEDNKKEIPSFGSRASVNPFIKDVNTGFM